MAEEGGLLIAGIPGDWNPGKRACGLAIHFA